MKKKPYQLNNVYRLLEPGPVLLVTTEYKGKSDVMAMSWHMMVDFMPPLVACIISNDHFSFKLLKKSKECVLNIPTKKIASKVVACGNVSGADLDKFKKFKLSTSPGSVVKAPLLDECYASLECVVADSHLATKYNLFILEVKKAWAEPYKKYPKTLHHLGRGQFMTAGKTFKLPSKMK